MNALARQGLINAGGIIESSFSPRKGMAEGDPEAEHGLRLVILDYPFAADGLLVWSAITDWVSSYFAHYYPEPSAVVDYDKLRFSGPSLGAPRGSQFRPVPVRRLLPHSHHHATPMPMESDASGNFADWPEAGPMRCFPSQAEAMVVIAVLNVLSSRSPDDEYVGALPQAAWAEEAVVKVAFERFKRRMKEIEGIIDGRNRDAGLRNRSSRMSF
ncbi:hypothetical protein HPP92_019681 [Vanilla planifolia]|uniref:Lipoxygenase domain-containing protein n=1 Tax=Vanilla planifolia TaxID=51239 RepID=A0A835UJ52_VANPL|nr:hypothetical protein HPP92_019681 [Vanilla planifolia]